jgi:hypothetical protein
LAIAEDAEDDANGGSSNSSFVLPFLQQGYALFLQEKDEELSVIKQTMVEAFGETIAHPFPFLSVSHVYTHLPQGLNTPSSRRRLAKRRLVTKPCSGS